MLSAELHTKLSAYGIEAGDETTLREALESQIQTYTLFKLASWPARRWKCHYRLMTRDQMYDGQSVEDVYALALLGRLEST
ncbi:MAG TPA: hypothetical protein VFV38_03610 [Ktedonobacteraceae bacterium]|nr:hypothetical protein [Ktedonobacteraceae bacterium]